MCDFYNLQPVTASREPFATIVRGNFVAEPDLAELMRDPMTEALMAADRVDRRELCALISQMRVTLAPAPARRA